MRTEEQLEKMLSLAHYRYMETGLVIWEGWKWALTWALGKDEDEDYKFMPKTKEEARQLGDELGLPPEWIE